jgi:hypothetical protein
MAILVQNSDFVGKYAISLTDNNTPLFNQLATSVELKLINNLLGLTIAPLFLAECAGNNGVPTSADYLAIYNPIQLTNTCNFENYSSGIKEMVLAAVWVAWINELSFTSTTLGLRVQDTTNSKPVSGNAFVVVNKYNLSTANYIVIQQYINENIEDYPDFDGIERNYMSAF